MINDVGDVENALLERFLIGSAGVDDDAQYRALRASLRPGSITCFDVTNRHCHVLFPIKPNDARAWLQLVNLPLALRIDTLRLAAATQQGGPVEDCVGSHRTWLARGHYLGFGV